MEGTLFKVGVSVLLSRRVLKENSLFLEIQLHSSWSPVVWSGVPLASQKARPILT